MARIKLAYIGGGSTRAPGTMASLIDQGENFDGSEIVLIDLNEERLRIVQQIAQNMATAKGLDLRITATTNRREGLTDCDAVLTSFRPGGFEARYLDESIALKHGIIGQETQGPGGFFMALRSIHIIQAIIRDMEAVCPRARLFNYTNPINIISQALVHETAIPVVSLCEGPIIFPRMLAKAADLNPDLVDAVMIGINHNCWSIRHEYDGQDMMPLLEDAYERKRSMKGVPLQDLRLLQIAATMGSIPSAYFQYYYFHDEIVAESRQKGTTRAQDIMKSVPDYWTHYVEQAQQPNPSLDPSRSRGGIHELELAIDVMDAFYNDRQEIWPVNIRNGGAISDLPDDTIVEVPGFVDKHGISAVMQGALPKQVAGLVKSLAEYQVLTAEAAWRGNRKDGIRALLSHPWVHSLDKAESIYDEMSAALKDYLPERLLRRGNH